MNIFKKKKGSTYWYIHKLRIKPVKHDEISVKSGCPICIIDIVKTIWMELSVDCFPLDIELNGHCLKGILTLSETINEMKLIMGWTG
jgi:hypothetical protein